MTKTRRRETYLLGYQTLRLLPEGQILRERQTYSHETKRLRSKIVEKVLGDLEEGGQSPFRYYASTCR